MFHRTLLKWLGQGADATPGPVAGEAPVGVPAAVSDERNRPGIDVVRGLEIWRQADIYQKFLRKFAADYADCGTRISRAMEAGERAAAAALAHKTKGAAANLALVDVARIAAEIDQDVKAGGDIAGLLGRFQQALDTTLASIVGYAPSLETGSASSGPLDRESAARAAVALAGLMRALDADNPDGAEPLLRELTSLLSAEVMQSVGMMLNDFDFRGAEAATRKIAQSLGISLRT